MRQWIAQVYGGEVLAKCLLAAMGIVLVRGMKVEDYATYTIAMAGIGLIGQALSSSVNRVYVLSEREAHLTGFRNEEETAAGFWALQMGIVCLLATIIGCVLAWRWEFWLAVWMVMASCSAEFAKAYHQRKQSFARFSLLEVSRASLCLGGVGVVSLFAGSISMGQALTMQAAALTFVFMVGLAHVWPKWRRVAWSRVGQLMFEVLRGPQRWLLAHALCITVLLQLDVAMLRYWCDDLQVATFGAALRFAALISLALNAVHIVLLPSANSLRVPAARTALIHQHRRTLPLFVLGVVLTTFALHVVIPLIDGGKYPDSMLCFNVLAASSIVGFAFSPYFHVLAAQGEYRFLALIALAGIFVDFLANSLLVPHKGAIGAALSVALSTAFVNVAMYFRTQIAKETPKLLRKAA
jgi:O-antigen/teichoic acid export membrane protein